MTNGNDLVYPTPHVNQDGTVQHDVHFGLTKREYLAATILNGLFASWGDHDVTDFHDLASNAVNAADALSW